MTQCSLVDLYCFNNPEDKGSTSDRKVATYWRHYISCPPKITNFKLNFAVTFYREIKQNKSEKYVIFLDQFNEARDRYVSMIQTAFV
jgi:hypothetical protein